MSDLRIDRIVLTLNGVSAEIAQSAIDGLEGELARRLSVRGLDAAVLRDVMPAIRLPTIEAGSAVDAETLRTLIADGLMAFLSPPVTRNADTEAN
ncbi:hypothetical protein [Nitrosospira sp. NRS527]|uniref:hypothetical protein n=1 Tax=Nitrosospira sp. NRS527 TaxID=155925 RepID=UPI001AFAFC6B|nr:hypothetical protein [Nitrosospira sp. NRS527]BCT67374.1 hypothetical protein NNRS527_00956 [Nitrosospira sp. NRS527]